MLQVREPRDAWFPPDTWYYHGLAQFRSWRFRETINRNYATRVFGSSRPSTSGFELLAQLAETPPPEQTRPPMLDLQAYPDSEVRLGQESTLFCPTYRTISSLLSGCLTLGDREEVLGYQQHTRAIFIKPATIRGAIGLVGMN